MRKKKTDAPGANKHERDEFHMKTFTPIGVFGIRKKGAEETPGVLSRDERPGGEFVSAEPRADDPGVLDLRPVYATNKGPAQVATPAYRASHERIFGKPKDKRHSVN